MQAVDVRHQDWRSQEEQENVTHEEVRAPERKFDDLHDKLSSRLRHSMGTESTSIPLASPPSTIGFIVFELS